MKLARAERHLDELAAAIGPALDAVRVGVATETTYEPSTGRFAVNVTSAPELSPEISAIVGDVIHNLRSALDYAAFQAVWKEQGQPYVYSEFPISYTSKYSSGGKETMKRLGEGFAAVIQRHQPLGNVDDYVRAGLASNVREAFEMRTANYPLSLLRELSNADKHRLLLPRYARALDASYSARQTHDCEPTLTWYSRAGALIPGTGPIAVFWANPTGPEPSMDTEMRFRPSVGVGGVDVREALDSVAEKVFAVIRDLDPLF